jgi:heptosyltransferase I
MKNNIQSICLLRLSAIGDVTHVLPVIATLQKAYPQASITWVIGKLEYKLMSGLPGVDFVIFDKSMGRKGYKDLKTTLCHQTFDVLLQMQYSFRANRAAWQIKARNRIGFDKKRSRELHGYKLTQRIAAVEKQHVLDSFMEFVIAMNIDELVYKWDIVVSDEDRKKAQQFIKPKQKNVIISPCSSSVFKDWSVENYVEIVKYLVNELKVHVVLCGGPSQREIDVSAKIEKMANVSVTNITGKDTLKQLYALLQSADLVISPDSGPLHMSSAARTPVIGLFAATTVKRSGAYNYQDLAVDCFAQAAQKFLNKSPNDIRWGGQVKCHGAMDLVTVDAVKEKIDSVIKENIK